MVGSTKAKTTAIIIKKVDGKETSMDEQEISPEQFTFYQLPLSHSHNQHSAVHSEGSLL